jgi:hypothetical protein
MPTKAYRAGVIFFPDTSNRRVASADLSPPKLLGFPRLCKKDLRVPSRSNRHLQPCRDTSNQEVT